MTAKSSFFMTASVLLILPILLTAGENPIVHLAGVRIAGPGYGRNGTELQPFHQTSGTTLALVVEAPDNRKIVEVDDDKSALTAFKDDQGNSLLDDVRWGGFPKISEDGRFALVEVSSKTRPSPGSLQIYSQGTVHMVVAASSVTRKIDNLNLHAGAKATLPEEIMQVTKVQMEDNNLLLVVQISRKLNENMRDIRFYTAAGELIEVHGQGTLSFGNAAQMEFYLDMKMIPDTLQVEIDLWQEKEVLDISFELNAGLGI